MKRAMQMNGCALRAWLAVGSAVLVFSGGCGVAQAQASLNDAHTGGIDLAQQNLREVGTGRINEQTASQVPMYKQNPKQQQGFNGGFGDLAQIGADRVIESKGYAAGSCDKEGFDPVAAARDYMTPERWASMSAAQQQKAINDQVAYFDQECEGINFLAGDYKGRIEYEIQPDDDLSTWKPNPGTPDGGSACTVKEVYTPDEFSYDYCTESNALQKKHCKKEAVVSIYYDNVLPDAPYTRVVANDKAPDWTVTVNPKQGWVDVTGYHVPIGSHWETCNSGGDAGMDYPCEVTDYGTKTERISIYGAQTSMQQGYRCGANGNCGEWFVIYSQAIDQCTFRFNNYHIRGGAGYPDVHDYSQYNFCVPERRVTVNWQDNCSILDAASN